MNENNIFSVKMSQKVYNTFGICMGRKGDVLNLHFDLIPFLIDVYSFNTLEKFITNGALDTVSRNDDGISLIIAPFFEDLH